MASGDRFPSILDPSNHTLCCIFFVTVFLLLGKLDDILAKVVGDVTLLEGILAWEWGEGRDCGGCPSRG